MITPILTVNNASGVNQSQVNLTAILTDPTNNNQGIPGETVIFTINNVSVGEATTDSTGTATLPYTINQLSGCYSTIQAEFEGDNNYNPAVNSNALYVQTIITPYLTVTELQQRAGNKGIDTTIYTDDELTEYIEAVQLEIEDKTGRYFALRQVTERFTRVTGTSLNLRYYPVLPNTLGFSINEGPLVDSIIVDNVEIDWYLTEPDYGIITFDVPYLNWGPYRVNNMIIQYTTCPFLNDPTKIHPGAKKLLSDMLIAGFVMDPSGHAVSSFKDGDFNINFMQEDIWQRKLDLLSRPVMEPVYWG